MTLGSIFFRKMILALSIGALHSKSLVQVIICATIEVLFLFMMLVLRPYKLKLEQIVVSYVSACRAICMVALLYMLTNPTIQKNKGTPHITILIVLVVRRV